MFRNFIVLAYRHFIRSPLTSFIELFGMTAGLTVFLLVLLWVSHETSYDEFNEKADRIYRLELDHNNERSCLHSTIVAPLLKGNVPEIESIVRFRSMGNGHEQVFVVNDKGLKNYYDGGLALWTENAFFEMFSFQFIQGNPKTALQAKNTVVITENFAKTVFGTTEAMGELIDEELTVSGVVKDVSNFHIPFKMLRSFESLEGKHEYTENGTAKLDRWGLDLHPLYVLLPSESDTKHLEKKISENLWNHYPNELKERYENVERKYYLRPLDDIYFNGGTVRERGYAIHGDNKKIVAYTSIAIFTLFLACINFINLNSAKAFERAKEIGIKKVSGASRMHVFVQFIGEVFLLCVVSLSLALIFSHTALPFFNNVLNTKLSMSQLLSPKVFLSMITGLIFISLASGGVPALYMSSFEPVRAIKGLSISNGKGFNFKRMGLVFQFSITIILLIGSITAFRQVQFMKYIDLAFGEENTTLITFDINQLSTHKQDAIKRSLLASPNIHSVSLTISTGVPGQNRSVGGRMMPVTLNGVEYQMTGAGVDSEYMETLGLELSQGSFFRRNPNNNLSPSSNIEKTRDVVLNKTAVRIMGLENPIGTKLKWWGGNFRVIGVIKDFHLNSVDNPILPLVMGQLVYGTKFMAKISINDIPNTVSYVEAQVDKIMDKKPQVEFLDNLYLKHYEDEDDFATLVGNFTVLAILIACLGLLGVATHAIKMRIKEIGIRKTMGASTLQILKLITSPFIKTIIISVVLAMPIAWVTMQDWLDNYPYRTDLPWWVFAVACGLTVVVAAFTIIWQSWRASSVNPARLIRYE